MKAALPLEQRDLAQILAVEVEQVERDEAPSVERRSVKLCVGQL